MSGERLTPYVDGVADAAVGETAPEFSSIDFSGAPSGITNDGVPKVILFLAHWCPHCQAEVPALQAWIDQNGLPEGVEFISVATAISEARPNYPPNAWLEGEAWTPRVVMDDLANTISGYFGLGGFPYYVFVDGDGKVDLRIGGGVEPAVVAGLMADLAARDATG